LDADGDGLACEDELPSSGVDPIDGTESFIVTTARTSNNCPEPFVSNFDPNNPETAKTFTCLAPGDIAPPAETEAFVPVPDDGDPLTLENSCEGIVSQEDFEACDAARAQYFEPEAPSSTPTPAVQAPVMSETMSALPDTSGLKVLLPVAGLLVGAGLLGMGVLRKR
jgi:hypothetical protein